MNTWLPHKAVMSVVMLSYPEPSVRVLGARSNKGCESIPITMEIITTFYFLWLT